MPLRQSQEMTANDSPFRALLRRAERLGERYSNLRVSFFFAVVTFALIGVFHREWRVFYQSLALLFIFLFFVSVWIHQGIKQDIVRIKKRIGLEDALMAIRHHDWPNIPAATPIPDGLSPPAYFTDLDLVDGHALFRLVNQTISSAGLRRLFARFGDAPIEKSEIMKRQNQTRTLSRLRLLRRKFLLAARTDGGWMESDKLLSLVREKDLARDGAGLVFGFQIGVYAFFWALFFAGILWPMRPYFLFAPVAELLIYPFVSRRIGVVKAYDFAQSVSSSLGRLASTFGVLERSSGTPDPALGKLLEPFRSGEAQPSLAIRRLDRIVGALGVRQNYLVHLICNVLLPWDAFWTMRLEKSRRHLEARLPQWLEAHSEFEVCASLAEFSVCFPDYIFPQVLDEGDTFIYARNLRHPLIAPGRVVGNDVSLSREARCLLITGSNMSGKSTYLRSVGIALLLSRAGAPVPADALSFRNLRIATALRITDSLEEGASSFYSEVRQLKNILDLCGQTEPFIYLVDEVLRGTNNRERLIGSTYLLKELARTRACGLVTTHDLELAKLDIEGVRNFHFSEEISGGKMTFHFKLQPGPCTSTNALRVMRMAGIDVPLDAGLVE